MSELVSFHEIQTTDSEALKIEITNSLLQKNASLSPKFLYDNLGSHLFAAITLLPEYYPTRTEELIFKEYADSISQTVGTSRVFIDLGAGNCQKAAQLFSKLTPKHYFALDISVQYLREILPNLQGQYPQIQMAGVGVDFSKKLLLPSAVPKSERVFFYPGSSLGNFSAIEAIEFLKQIKEQACHGGLLFGIDLMKEAPILYQAYDDPLKVTAAFNLNILRVVNHLIGTNFEVQNFSHQIVINEELMRVELYLESLKNQVVSWPGHERVFEVGERIHTENSHKYTLNSIERILEEAGLQSQKIWQDPKNWFAVIYAK